MARVVPGGALRVLCLLIALTTPVAAQPPPPELTQPINDFAGVIDQASSAAMEALIRSLQQASGDVVVVATVETFAPYGDIREYANQMFENRGRGIGARAKDNGLLVLLAVTDRQVWVEVGYDLEAFIPDGFAGETSREYMTPQFRTGAYGAGLLAGVTRVVERIAEQRNVTLEGVRTSRPADPEGDLETLLPVAIFVLFVLLNAIAARTRKKRFGSRRGGWSGWHSGVGPFGGGGGFGGGFGGFGGGGGFGGFGGGRSGGGGGGGRW